MKAPELPTKIYFTILDMGSGYVYTPSLDDNGGTEYIRKDALLEWANKMLQDTADRLDFHGNRAFAELYSKLNSI